MSSEKKSVLEEVAKYILLTNRFEWKSSLHRRVLDRSKYPLVSAGAIFTRGYQRIPSGHPADTSGYLRICKSPLRIGKRLLRIGNLSLLQHIRRHCTGHVAYPQGMC